VAARDTKELWWFARGRLDLLAKESSAVDRKVGGSSSSFSSSFPPSYHPACKVGGLLVELETRQQAVLLDLEQLKAADGFDSWREEEARDLSGLVQVI
jgi:hypothetical protein